MSVVGHSEYYPKFGFKKASEYGIPASFEVPDISFFPIELEKNGLKDCRGTVEYTKISWKFNYRSGFLLVLTIGTTCSDN